MVACTIGRFYTDAAAHGLTIVPGAFHFSLDVRAYAPEVLSDVEARFHAAIKDIEKSRKVTFELGSRAEAAVGEVSPRILGGLETAATSLGISTMRLGSPASHDAAAFAPVASLTVGGFRDFLLSDRAGYVTGTHLVADGGRTTCVAAGSLGVAPSSPPTTGES